MCRITSKFLLPLSELGVVSALVSHYPADIQKIMLSESLKTLQDTVALLAKIHSRESTKDTFKKNGHKLKRTQNGDPHMTETAIQARIAGRIYGRCIT